MKSPILSSVAAIVLLSGCETIDSAASIGTGAGAAIGGLLGNQIADENKTLWTMAGLAAGSFVGREIGKLLDESEKESVAESTVQSAETGETKKWSKTETGNSGSAKVIKTVETEENKTCREIQQTVSLADGTTKQDSVTACKGEDGAWQVV